MKIAICDDNKIYMEAFTELLCRVMDKLDMQYEIIIKANSIELFKLLHEKNYADIYFMDIDLSSKETGIDLAQEVKAVNINAYIIFITDYLQYALQVFKAHPFSFLPKPVTEKMLEQCLQEINSDISQKNELDSIEIKSGSVLFILKSNEIIYIEKYAGKCVIYLKNKKIETFESLSSLENRLGKFQNFIRCHKSFIINFNHVKELNLFDNKIILNENLYCFIGRHYKSNVMEKSGMRYKSEI
jgi:DNA-binding LytR/AlgR family response regulator